MDVGKIDANLIASFISEFGFGLLISDDLQVTHLPLVYLPSQDGDHNKGKLIGHMARANPQWRDLASKKVKVVFSGPHSYISPTWYISRPAVSTWNYASVQCSGIFSVLEKDDTLDAINQLIQKYEPQILGDHSLMSHDYVERLLRAVVGFSIDVQAVKMIEKLGQQKKNEDQLGVFKHLSQSDNAESAALANYMKARDLGIGTD